MLSEYHQKYANKSDDELEKRINEKLKELVLINKTVRPNFSSGALRVAVMGCGDKRFVQGHRKIFSEVFNLPVQIITFDITVDHLAGEADVYQHDCTLPLPKGPFDITFAHVLLRFVPKDKQYELVKNSYDALKPSGIAIHVLDPEDYETTDLVDFAAIESELKSANVTYVIVKLPIGQALILKR